MAKKKEGKIVDAAEELCQLLDLRKQASEKLKSLEPGTEGYSDALKAVTDLTKAIDVEERRGLEDELENKKLEIEIERIKEDQAERKRQFEEDMNRRKKEFVISTGINVAGGVAKGVMVTGFQAQEFNGSTLLTTKKAQEFTRDFFHFGRKK